MTTTRTLTTCPYCGVGCGVQIEQQGDQLLPVKGDSMHPANHGRLCVKGSALHETVSQRTRLLAPRVAGREVSWSMALDAVASALKHTVAECGPQAAGLYLSGQLLTEDYYAANKFFKGFVGSANVDTNSRLCMSSAVAAHQRAFGEDVVPGCYEDIEQASLVVLAGSNMAWTHPVVYQRLQAARETDPSRKLVVIDPRRTDTCEAADLHLAIAPGSDAWLFNGLLVYLSDHACLDEAFIREHSRGFEAALQQACSSSPDIATVARRCAVPEQDVETFYRWFAQHAQTVTVFSQGINQSQSGTDKGNAIINCHLATGRIGKPGATPFSITGQPNAMGGREVGGLANVLAAHMGFDEDSVRAVSAFWGSAQVASQPGLKALELFEAIERGEVRFLWIMATNPLVSLPDAARWEKALSQCTVVVSDCVADTDTTRLADILLPAQGWGEKNGTVTNSDRTVSRQRAFLNPPPQARPDWWIVSEVAKRLGFGRAFGWSSPAAVFAEHAALTGVDNGSRRLFDISALASMDEQAYEQLQPFQWPRPATGNHAATRLYADGRFSHGDGRARFVAIQPQPPAAPVSHSYPFLLNTGRVRDQWHTMTRTSLSERLLTHRQEPCLEMHPDDAARLSLADGDIAEVKNDRGSLLLRVQLNAGQQRGSVFAPMHWNDRFAARARVGTLIPPLADPVSGQPELKQTAVAVLPWPARWHGLLVSVQAIGLDRQQHYWARWDLGSGSVSWLAGQHAPAHVEAQLTARLGEPSQHLRDGDERRMAWFDASGALQAVWMQMPHNRLPSPWWLASLLGTVVPAEDRRSVLLGVASGRAAPRGAMVCSCFQVDEGSIRDAIAEGCHSVEALGERLRCGTNCGSCLPELKRMVISRDLDNQEAVA